MNIEMIWTLIYSCLVIGLIAGALLWFLLPKKWILWSEKAAEILPQETAPPWGSVNLYGKVLYIIFLGGVILSMVLMFIGYLFE